METARAEYREEVLAGLERWKLRHPEVVPYLEPADVLVDSMRGRSTTWTRIGVNLVHVPAADRPVQEALEVDYDPWQRGGAVTDPYRARRSCEGRDPSSRQSPG